MNKQDCSNCYFGDKCRSNRICDNYAPIYDDDTYLDKIIESRKLSFLDDWYQYANEYSH